MPRLKIPLKMSYSSCYPEANFWTQTRSTTSLQTRSTTSSFKKKIDSLNGLVINRQRFTKYTSKDNYSASNFNLLHNRNIRVFVQPIETVLSIPPVSIDPVASIPPKPIDPVVSIPPKPIDPVASIPPAPIDPVVSIPPAPIDPVVSILPKPIDPVVSIPPEPIDPVLSIPPAPIDPVVSIPPKSIEPVVSIQPELIAPVSATMQILRQFQPTPKLTKKQMQQKRRISTRKIIKKKVPELPSLDLPQSSQDEYVTNFENHFVQCMNQSKPSKFVQNLIDKCRRRSTSFLFQLSAMQNEYCTSESSHIQILYCHQLIMGNYNTQEAINTLNMLAMDSEVIQNAKSYQAVLRLLIYQYHRTNRLDMMTNFINKLRKNCKI